MRKFVGLLILLVISITGCSLLPPFNPDGEKWTIMVYMIADNNLESYALEDLNEMEIPNLDTNFVNIIALIDRSGGYSSADGDWAGTRLYKINHNTNEYSLASTRLSSSLLGLTNIGDNDELNMGDPTNLSRFVDFCVAEYPSQRTMLILWAHGDGWRTRFVPEYSPTTKGIGNDETDGDDGLNNDEIASALAGRKVDVIGFDTCYLGMLESAYAMRDTATYMIASPETEPGGGWKYDTWLRDFASNTITTNLYTTLVDSYAYYYEYITGSTLAVYDLTKMDSLFSAYQSFVGELIASTNNWWNSDRHNYTKDFFIMVTNNVEFIHNKSDYGPYHLDLYDFADKVNNSASSGVKTAYNQVVVYSWANLSGNPRSHGMCVYFATYRSANTPGFAPYVLIGHPVYIDGNVNSFLVASDWDNYLNAFHGFMQFDWIGVTNGLSNSIALYKNIYYQFYVTNAGTVTIELSVPANSDDDLYLYGGSASYTSIISTSTNTGNDIDESISESLTNGWYVIRVRRSVSSDVAQPYVLSLSNISATIY